VMDHKPRAALAAKSIKGSAPCDVNTGRTASLQKAETVTLFWRALFHPTHPLPDSLIAKMQGKVWSVFF
jgi:hypothetical protein